MSDNLAYCLNMLNNFTIHCLRALLEAYDLNTEGIETVLRSRAIEMIKKAPSNLHLLSYKNRVFEISRSMQIYQRKPQIISNQQRRMHRPTHKVKQTITRPGLPHAMPKVVRSMNGNSVGTNNIPGNSMLTNNIHYLSGYNQMAGPSREPIQSPSFQSTHRLSRKQPSLVLNKNVSIGVENAVIASPKVISKLKFKKSPFYDVNIEVMKPTVLRTSEKCSILYAPEDMKEKNFKILLTSDQVIAITNGNQFQIQFCQLEPGCTEVTNCAPSELYIQVNKLPVPLTSPNQFIMPINCTENMNISTLVPNTITINWFPEQKRFAIAMYLVEKFTVDTLIQKLKGKKSLSFEKRKRNIIQKLAYTDLELTTTSYRVSLECPLSKTRIKLPVKSIYCDHLKCFDASTFILMNEIKPTWMCPMCKKPCLYDDLRIDNYFLQVLQSPILKDCCKEIIILADGTWKLYEQNKDTNNINQQVNLDSGNKNSSFVDLTLHDD